MWRDAALTARLVVRPSGLAGLAASLAGLGALWTATRPWHVVAADVTMLGARQGRLVDGAAGSSLPWAVLVIVAGLVAVGLGAALAVDRHPGWTRPALLGAAAMLLVSGVVAVLLRPPLSGLAASSEALAEVVALRGSLPEGTALELTVRAGPAAFAAAIAGLVVAGATIGARELATR